MSIRITSNQIAYGSAQNIAATKARLAVLEQESSTGVALTKPSDDPAGVAQSLQVRAQQAANTQYGANIDDGLSWLSTVDSSLTSSEDLVRQAIDLTTQGANSGTMTAASADAIATQLDGVKADLVAQANTKYLGRSVFAGNSDAATAFDPSTYAYSGVSGSTVQRRINASETVTVSGDGAAAFGTGSSSVFAAIDSVSAALRSGDSAGVTSGLTTLQNALTTMTAAHATVGANYAHLTAAKTDNSSTTVALETQRSGIEDIDTTQVLLDLKTQENAYQASLQVTASVIQPTLMSFLQ